VTPSWLQAGGRYEPRARGCSLKTARPCAGRVATVSVGIHDWLALASSGTDCRFARMSNGKVARAPGRAGACCRRGAGSPVVPAPLLRAARTTVLRLVHSAPPGRTARLCSRVNPRGADRLGDRAPDLCIARRMGARFRGSALMSRCSPPSKLIGGAPQDRAGPAAIAFLESDRPDGLGPGDPNGDEALARAGGRHPYG
jgi:hypothetical protein